MPIPSNINDLNSTPSLNSPQGGDPIGGNMDDYFRSHAAIIKQMVSKGISLTSTTTLNIPPGGNSFNVTKGAIFSITGFSASFDGRLIILNFEEGITLVHSGNLILPLGTDVVTSASDLAFFFQDSTGVWICISWPRLERSKATAALDEYKEQATDEFVNVAGDTMSGPLIVANETNNTNVAPGAIEIMGPSPQIDFKDLLSEDFDWRIYKHPTGLLYFTNINGNNFTLNPATGDMFLPILGTGVGAAVNGKQASGNYAVGEFGNTFSFHWNGSAPYIRVNGGIYRRIWTDLDFAGSPVQKGAWITWQSGVIESGSVSSGGSTGEQVAELPQPYVMTGLRNQNGTHYLRGRILRNEL